MTKRIRSSLSCTLYMMFWCRAKQGGRGRSDQKLNLPLALEHVSTRFQCRYYRNKSNTYQSGSGATGAAENTFSRELKCILQYS